MISTRFILAIDLGKYNSVFCHYDLVTKATTFHSRPTTPQQFRQAFADHPTITVVIEACSPADWVHDLCEELHITILMANTNADATEARARLEKSFHRRAKELGYEVEKLEVPVEASSLE